MLNYGAPSWVYGEITEFAKQTDVRELLLGQCCDGLFAPSTSCTGVCLAITMLQYYICLGIVLTVILVLGLGLGFGIILYFVIGT